MRTLDLTAVREAWKDYYVPGFREIFRVHAHRPATEQEIERWFPFEGLIAMGPMTMDAFEAYAKRLFERFKWEYGYWWPWTELEDWEMPECLEVGR